MSLVLFKAKIWQNSSVDSHPTRNYKDTAKHSIIPFIKNTVYLCITDVYKHIHMHIVGNEVRENFYFLLYLLQNF